jgi:hypothetical protein
MVDWIKRINLLWLFVLLMGFHGLLYYSFGNDNWLFLAFSASVVDTAAAAALKLLLPDREKSK